MAASKNKNAETQCKISQKSHVREI